VKRQAEDRLKDFEVELASRQRVGHSSALPIPGDVVSIAPPRCRHSQVLAAAYHLARTFAR
jgi:hypothetical protein